MFRPVALPADVAGGLWAHSMPGRWEPLEQAWAEARTRGIQTIVCLATTEEIRDRSPSYAAALDAESTPCPVMAFPIVDLEAPRDREAFWSLASDIAARLTAGERLLVHCAAGIGRTGTLATCVLLALGRTPAEAEQDVSAAGSRPETARQRALVAWCAARASAGRTPGAR